MDDSKKNVRFQCNDNKATSIPLELVRFSEILETYIVLNPNYNDLVCNLNSTSTIVNQVFNKYLKIIHENNNNNARNEIKKEMKNLDEQDFLQYL